MGRAQTRQSGYKLNAASIWHLGSEFLDVGGALDDAELVAKPLHRRTTDEGASFERIDRRLLTGQLPGDGAQQACLAVHAILTGIHQNEGAGAKGALGGPPVKACLSEQCRLLITGNARDGHAIRQPRYAPRAAQVTT